MLKKECLVTKFGVGKAENELSKSEFLILRTPKNFISRLPYHVLRISNPETPSANRAFDVIEITEPKSK